MAWSLLCTLFGWKLKHWCVRTGAWRTVQSAVTLKYIGSWHVMGIAAGNTQVWLLGKHARKEHVKLLMNETINHIMDECGVAESNDCHHTCWLTLFILSVACSDPACDVTPSPWQLKWCSAYVSSTFISMTPPLSLSLILSPVALPNDVSLMTSLSSITSWWLGVTWSVPVSTGVMSRATSFCDTATHTNTHTYRVCE